MPFIPSDSAMLARLMTALTSPDEVKYLEFAMDFDPESHEILGDMTTLEKNLGVLVGTLNDEGGRLSDAYNEEVTSTEGPAIFARLTNLAALARTAQEVLNLSLRERFGGDTGYGSLAILKNGQIAGIIQSAESNRSQLRKELDSMLSGVGLEVLIMRIERPDGDPSGASH